MHNNYYFFQHLTPALHRILHGSVLSECFSQSKDELILRFERGPSPYFVKAQLQPAFTCLSFAEEFHRARKNSVDLFDILIGRKVEVIRQCLHERSFIIQFSDNYSLVFKMHGNRANLLIFEGEQVVNLFRKNLPGDTGLTLSSFDRPVNFSYENFLANVSRPDKLYFTFGKLVWQYLHEQGYTQRTPEAQYALIQETIQQMEQQSRFSITRMGQQLHLSLLPIGDVQKTWDDPIRAINEFFYSHTHDLAFEQERNTAASLIRAKIIAGENYYQKTFDKLAEVESDNNYKCWADLIMANLHAIRTGQEKVTLSNFYNHDLPIEIKLRRELSPQKNAEVFYRKAKNQHIEIHRLQTALQAKEQELQRLKEQLRQTEAADGLKSLRKTVSAFNLTPGKEKQAEILPYHEFEHGGFRIWVGRSAPHNDALTFKYGYKEDLWLHAKDVAGSHVLIKYQAGRPFPKDVIERAAQLAAYNSKRKTDTLCPVAVTPRKYIRKRKGDPPGAVVVEREEVLLVEPKL